MTSKPGPIVMGGNAGEIALMTALRHLCEASELHPADVTFALSTVQNEYRIKAFRLANES